MLTNKLILLFNLNLHFSDAIWISRQGSHWHVQEEKPDDFQANCRCYDDQTMRGISVCGVDLEYFEVKDWDGDGLIDTNDRKCVSESQNWDPPICDPDTPGCRASRWMSYDIC